MSGTQNKSNNVSDAAGKINQDDKCDFYESCENDSGFLSGGNILVSGENISTSEKINNTRSTASTSDLGIIDIKEEEPMRLDSGACMLTSSLSENFSNLNLNNLSRSKIEQETTTPVASKIADDIRWFQQDEDGDTHLHTAIVQGFAKVAFALIRIATHPQLLDTPNNDAQTPLHLAMETAQWQIVRWLIVAGARPCPRDVHGDSPLHLAAMAGSVEGAKAITDPVRADERRQLGLAYQPTHAQQPALDQWNYIGQTCVHVAAIHGHADVLRHLVSSGADVNAREGLQGYTALHYAVERRDERLVQYLLFECQTLNAQVTDYGGRNALQLCPVLPQKIEEALRSRGLPSPFSSDDEFDSESDDEEVQYQNTPIFVPNLVNASA